MLNEPGHESDAMRYYFTLQARLLYRKISEVGVHPWITVLTLSGLFAGGSVVLFNRLEHAGYWYAGICLLLNFPLGGKERNAFLKNIFTRNGYRLVRLCENLLTALPFVIFLACKGFFLLALCLIVLSAALSFNNRVGQPFFAIPTPFARWPFEFTTGFRRNLWAFVLIYALGFIALSVGNFNLALFALLLLFAVCQSFYFKLEPHFFIWVHARSAKHFVLDKMKTALFCSLIIALPLVVLLLVFHLQDAHWVALALAAGFSYSVLGAAAKYAFYPNELNIFHHFILGIGLLAPPVSLVLIPVFFLSSVKSLKVCL